MPGEQITRSHDGVPNLPGMLADKQRQSDTLFRRENPPEPDTKKELRGSLGGRLYRSVSCPDIVRGGGFITNFICLLGVAGTTNSVIRLIVGTDVISTINMAADATFVMNSLGFEIRPEVDFITYEITKAGQGASNLTTVVWYE